MMKSFNKFFSPQDLHQERFKALDGLRGIAILFVLLSHSSNENIYFFNLNFQGIGKTGVYLFFVLSAYLLDRQIALALLSGKARRLFWLNYFLRRFLRIYPLFFIGLFLFAIITRSGTDTGISLSSSIPLHLLLIQSKSIFWSVAVEFKYYFLSPLLLIFFHWVLKWKPFATLLCFIAIIATAILFRNQLGINSTFLYLPIFLIGTMIAVYELILKIKPWMGRRTFFIEWAGILTRHPLIIDGVAGLAFLIILVSTPHYFKKFFGLAPNFLDPLFLFPYGILWGMVLVSAKYGVGILRSFFGLKLFRFLGVISYSLYIFHIPVLILVDSAFLNIPQQFKIEAFFVMVILLSTISYLLIERPLSRIRLFKQSLKENDIRDAWTKKS
jgi:peptidoglycan/LPS O-acetylase OafA/YrhL